MKSILLSSLFAVALVIPALANDAHHPADTTAPSDQSVPTLAAPPSASTNAQGGMMADCPMMGDKGMMQGGQGMDAQGMGQGAGSQNGQMMHDGKMQCPMMNNRGDRKPAEDAKPPGDEQQSHHQ